MSQPVGNVWASEQILAAVINAVDGVFDGALLSLYQNDIEPGPADAVGAYTEADFDGYAAVAAVWSVTQNNGNRRFKATQLVQFIADGATTPNTVYGWYLTNAGGTEVIAARRFTDPVGIAGAGDSVSAQAVIRLG